MQNNSFCYKKWLSEREKHARRRAHSPGAKLQIEKWSRFKSHCI